MAGNWYYARNGQSYGPVTFAQLRQMVASGEVAPTDMVCDDETRQWLSAGAVEGLARESGGPSPAVSENWFFAGNGQRYGPFTFDQLRQMATSELLSPLTMIVNEGHTPWVSAGTVEGLFPAPVSGVPTTTPAAAEPRKASAELTGVPLALPVRTARAANQSRRSGVTHAQERDPPLAPILLEDAPARRNPLDVILAIAAALSIPFWCLNEFIGKAFLVLAGLIWLVLGSRALVTGRIPSFTGYSMERRVGYRAGGLVLGLLGAAMMLSGILTLLGRPGWREGEDDPSRWRRDAKQETIPELHKDAKATEQYAGKRGNFRLWLVPEMWNQQPPSNDDAEVQFKTRDGNLWAMVISECIEVPLDEVKQATLKSMRVADKDARLVKEETRRVNGVMVSVLTLEATIEGIPVTYHGYVHSSKRGTIQVQTWTARNLFEEMKPEMERLLNGLEVIP